MALRHSADARRFYQSAQQRFADGQFLLEGDRTTGAIYLAGYAIECILKALVLSILPSKKRAAMAESFRGSKGHNYEWLKTTYLEKGGAVLPPDVARCFAMANTWTTDLRYEPGTAKPREAKRFLSAARDILTWAEGRL